MTVKLKVFAFGGGWIQSPDNVLKTHSIPPLPSLSAALLWGLLSGGYSHHKSKMVISFPDTPPPERLASVPHNSINKNSGVEYHWNREGPRPELILMVRG